MRSYKIQEVIKRRQIILVQVVKEERGSKGAALTTYLSLAGRYTVLMPNTGRGGGISRKITNAQDRKRLKAIAHELEVPDGMGLIVRTAGAARTKQELKRDFEYLLRLWENVRDMTLQSTAPCLVYEEGNLIKRSIRDLYTKDIDEILVAGEPAHKEAQDFMRMLSPSQAKNVIKFEDTEPLFARYKIERQLNAMFSPYVTLRSGGYLVINQTEALVSIDVNSGKSTREFSIEETALQTNLEASEELARQLKLRDLAGLIVIDFIDMEERRNNRKVENRLKDALRHDRARIQVGRISHFGLLEMSRQRLQDRRGRRLDVAVPALPGHGHRPLHRVGGARRAARHRGSSGARCALVPDGGHDGGCRALHPQQQALLRHRHGAPARRFHHGGGQRPHAGRQFRHREIGRTRSRRRRQPSGPRPSTWRGASKGRTSEEAPAKKPRPGRAEPESEGEGEGEGRRPRRRRRAARPARGSRRAARHGASRPGLRPTARPTKARRTRRRKTMSGPPRRPRRRSRGYPRGRRAALGDRSATRKATNGAGAGGAGAGAAAGGAATGMRRASADDTAAPTWQRFRCGASGPRGRRRSSHMSPMSRPRSRRTRPERARARAHARCRHGLATTETAVEHASRGRPHRARAGSDA